MTVYQEPFLTKGMSAWKIVSNLEPTVPADAPRSTIDYIFVIHKINGGVLNPLLIK